MIDTVRVLVVEDNPADVDLIREYLPGTHLVRFQIESVSRLSEAIARLQKSPVDLILIDLGLPDSQGSATFSRLQQEAPETPAIILTGYDNEETAVAAVRNGAQDYLIKGELNGSVLVRAARYALERKRTEETLRESEGKLKALFGILPVGVAVLDADRNMLFRNSALDAILGFAEDDQSLGALKKRSYLRPDGTPMPNEEIASVRAFREQRAISNIETGIVKEDGQTIWLSVNAVPVGFPDWKVVVASNDITARKQNEQQQALAMQVLAALNRRNDVGRLVGDILRMIKESTGLECAAIRLKEGDDYPYYVADGFAAPFIETERRLCEQDETGRTALDSDGQPRLACMCGTIIRGRSDPSLPFFTERGSFWSNSMTELIAATPDIARRFLTRNRCHRDGFESTALIPLSSGNEVIGLLQLSDRRRGMFTLEKIKFFEEMGAAIGVAVARKRAVTAMESSLREKEVLIREIHHRVKNNMQVVSSLLSLQSAATGSEECRGILNEVRTRIRAMSLVHEKLYQSKNLVQIDFGDYAANLAAHLFQIYQITPDQIRLEMALEKVLLDINLSVPCGLLINELISNAIKHAFPQGRQGVVRLGLRRGVDKRVELRVGDDGSGLPEDFDFRKTGTLGFQIVNSLLLQMDASIELDRTNGTCFTVSIPEPNYKPRL